MEVPGLVDIDMERGTKDEGSYQLDRKQVNELSEAIGQIKTWLYVATVPWPLHLTLSKRLSKVNWPWAEIWNLKCVSAGVVPTLALE